MTDLGHTPNPIVDGLRAAWAAAADGRPGDAEQIIHDLHAVHGTVEVLATAAALAAGPAPAGGVGRG